MSSILTASPFLLLVDNLSTNYTDSLEFSNRTSTSVLAFQRGILVFYSHEDLLVGISRFSMIPTKRECGNKNFFVTHFLEIPASFLVFDYLESSASIVCRCRRPTSCNNPPCGGTSACSIVGIIVMGIMCIAAPIIVAPRRRWGIVCQNKKEVNNSESS